MRSDAVGRQVAEGVFRTGARHDVTFERQQHNALGLTQDGHGHKHGTRGLGAGVPVDDNGFAERLARRRRRHQQRSTTVKQTGLQRRHARAAIAGAAQHGHVVNTPKTAQGAILDHRAATPAKAWSLALLAGMARGKGIERLAHGANKIGLVPVGRRDGHGHNRIGRDDFREGRAQRHTLDGGVKHLRELPGRFERRRHLLALIHRQKDALHGGIQL